MIQFESLHIGQNEKLMPDQLPPNFSSWLDFLIFVEKEFKNRMEPLNENSVCKFFIIDPMLNSASIQQIYSVYAFPYILIRSRAYTEVIAAIPHEASICAAIKALMENYNGSNPTIEFENLFSISRMINR